MCVRFFNFRSSTHAFKAFFSTLFALTLCLIKQHKLTTEPYYYQQCWQPIDTDPILCIIWLFRSRVYFFLFKTSKREVVYLFFPHQCPIFPMLRIILQQENPFLVCLLCTVCMKCEWCLSDNAYPLHVSPLNAASCRRMLTERFVTKLHLEKFV